MHDSSFINRYGLNIDVGGHLIEQRECCYIVVKKEDSLLCLYDTIYGLYKFPNTQNVTINENPSLEFTLHADIAEHGHFIKETQLYRVYDVEDVHIEGENLGWCAINDILISKIPFDATQKYGFKNLLVRVRR